MSLIDLGRLLQRTLAYFFLLPVVCGSIYALLCLLASLRFRAMRLKPARKTLSSWPPVTILKPIHGLEKNLLENLRSTCIQDYPEFQVVLSVQKLDDPAIPLMKAVQKEFGASRVTVAIEKKCTGTNGKINNMIGGLLHARHDVLVISDSDVRLRPDYLKTIVAPLSDPEVGCVCTLYRVACADKWYEKLELLSLNSDLMIHMIFALVTGASKFCLGASAALRRSTLDEIGGFEGLADYLVEDYEMGCRILNSGKDVLVLPYLVETMVDLKRPGQWWSHQVYWDQNNRAARPVAYFAAGIVRSMPFAFLHLLVNPGLFSLEVLAIASVIRLSTAAVILRLGLDDREGFRSLWLLPFRDLSALASLSLAYVKKTTIWRGSEFKLTSDGRLVSIEAKP
jgi:ceramide glucosyltransferase